MPSAPTGVVSLTVDAQVSDAVVYSDFYVRPVAGSTERPEAFSDADGSYTGFFKIDQEGQLYVFHGDGQGGGQWLPTGAKFALNERDQAQDWIRLFSEATKGPTGHTFPPFFFLSITIAKPKQKQKLLLQ